MKVPSIRMYVLPLEGLQSYYDGYMMSNIYQKYGIIPTTTTFMEDINVLVRYVNGELEDNDIVDYAEQTRLPVDDQGINERELLMFGLYRELECWLFNLIPDYRIGCEVKMAVENGIIYLVDLRKKVYVPEALRDYVEY